jgi:chromosomal replication initiation ATPase DnaA
MPRKAKTKLPPVNAVMQVPAPIRELAEKIARKYMLRTDDLLRVYKNGVRRKQLNLARHELWVVTQNTLDLSYPETGYMFGVDHTSVMAAQKEYESRPTWPKL